MRNIFCSFFIALAIIVSSLPAKAVDVLVVTWRGKTEAETGFETRLKQLQPDAKFQYIDAGKNRESLTKDIKNFNFSEIDLVYTFGTTSSQIVKRQLRGQKPQVFNIVSSPRSAGIVRSMKRPGKAITGAHHGVFLDIQIDVLAKIKEFKTIGVLVDPTDRRTSRVYNEVRNDVKKLGKKTHQIQLRADSSKFEQNLAKAVEAASKVDVIYIPGSSAYLDKATEILEALPPSSFIVGGVPNYIGKGATIAFSANYKERGESVAELAHKILTGTSTNKLPVSTVAPDNAQLLIDKKQEAANTLQNLGDLEIEVIEK